MNTATACASKPAMTKAPIATDTPAALRARLVKMADDLEAKLRAASLFDGPDGQEVADIRSACAYIDSCKDAHGELASLNDRLAAYHTWGRAIGEHIVASHRAGQVDEAAVAILDGYHVGVREVAGGGQGEPGETTLEAALRLLKLAKDRGAFDPPTDAASLREAYECGVPIGTREERQALIAEWTRATFGEDMMAPHERIMRFVEEAAELAQAEGLPVERVEDIVSYVYARPVGDPSQELGGVSLTLLAYAASKGLSADLAEAREVSRVLQRDPDYFRKRNLEKAAAGIGDYKG